jgi:DNA polymerase-3 subunit epsilon
MKLKLERPIIFLDLETTGIDIARDRVVELSLVKVAPDGERETKTRRVNPEMHIPEDATAIHGITDDDVRDCPPFRAIAKSLAAYMAGCDLGGFNSNRFDIPLLAEEFLRAGVDVDFKERRFVDVQSIFHRKERRTLEAAYRFYCDKTLEDAHSAEADVTATFEVLEAQLDRYPDLENDVAFLADYSARDRFADYAGRIALDEAGVERFTFGKHRGRAVAEVFERDPGYYTWMMEGDFPAFTKKVITEIKLRSTPQQ